MLSDAAIMRDAAHEIVALRRRLEVLEAKDRVFEAMASLHFSPPNGGQMGACVDVAWQLGQRAAEIESTAADVVAKSGEAAN